MSDVIAGQWWQPGGWRRAHCFHDSHVVKLETIASTGASDFADSPLYMPSAVDLHVHGGGGADVMQGEAALRQVLRTHAANGTAAMLATSVTAPFEAIDSFLADVKAVMASPADDEATLLGAHLEGPFINPDKLGAQPPHAVKVDGKALQRWLDTGVVRVITFAPEMDDAGQLGAACQRTNVKAQLGHSLCSWAVACRELAAGAGVTHLYNAMSGFSHRDGGLAVASLAMAEQAEIIPDGIHVDEVAFRAADRAIPGLYGVTDATAAAGMPDGHFPLGSLRVEKAGNRVQLPDGTLAGSCLTERAAVEQLRGWGYDWHYIAQLLSARPAHWINAVGVGVIAKGAEASWLEIQDDQLTAVWLRGQRQALNAACG